jgi:hypothetical protein
LIDPVEQGHANRKQGYYGECVVRAIAAAAHLKVTKEELEPDGVDFEVKQDQPGRYPRFKRIELSVKTHSNLSRTLNGKVGEELDIPRFLVVVDSPKHFSEYCCLEDNKVSFSNLAYWHDLMGEPDLPANQGTVTVSVPEGNLLTPETMVALTCGDREEAARWMSA